MTQTDFGIGETRMAHCFRRGRRSPATTLTIAAIAALSACSKHNPGAYQGYVEGEFVHIGSGVAGRLERLFVARGQAVEANGALFELEANQEAAAVRQADEALGAAKAQLADLGTGKRRSEVEVARAQLEQATAAEKQSGSQLARDTAQLEAGGISRMQLEASRTRHEMDLARVRELEGQLEVAELSARPDQVRAQTSQVAAMRAAADQTRWRLDQKHVVATQAGVVVDTLFREGEWVPAGSPVVRMLPPGNVKVRFFVPQPSLGLVPIGRKLEVRCDGCANAAAATVSYVSPEPEFTPPIIYSNDTRAKLVFMVEARSAEEGAVLLRPGQPVEVVLQ
jgi:HlyD family secretion protein